MFTYSTNCSVLWWLYSNTQGRKMENFNVCIFIIYVLSFMYFVIIIIIILFIINVHIQKIRMC